MQRSTERILTTHTGSLPRSERLAAQMIARTEGEAVDEAALERDVAAAVVDVVGYEIDAGVDVVNDGEQSKISYTNYVADRLAGFGGKGRHLENIGRTDFPEFEARRASEPGYRPIPPVCVGPVSHKSLDGVQRDVKNLRAALNGRQPSDVFMTAASPGQIARFLFNEYYPTHEAYVWALAEAMKPEYHAIVEAGFVLQLDCPDLASGRSNQFQDATDEQFRSVMRLHVEALNASVADIDPDQLRMHVCWGNYEGPHHRDIPLKSILDILFTARPNAISFEAANPRHEHEWKLFEEVRLPEGKVLLPGVIDSTTNYIEHPELVAQRLIRYATLVGQANVLASVDCGFATYVGRSAVDTRIAWAKLAAMAEGAKIASHELAGAPKSVTLV